MTFFSKRKRKNDDPPRIPAWILVLIAIGAVIIVVILFQPTTRNAVELPVQQVVVTASPDYFDITATYIIQQATALAQGTPQPPVVVGADNLAPIQVTATYLIEQATALAQGTPQAAINLNPIEMTATYIVKQATLQASTPNS